MRLSVNAAAAALLAVCLVPSYAQTSETKPPVKKHVAAPKAKTPPAPTVQEQIQALRQQLQDQASQIESLKTGMAEKDAQLKKTAQAAADAQAAAARAEAAASLQQQAVGDNAAAVTTLQSAVTGLKSSQTTLATTVTDETAKIKKAIDNPSALHYKGIALTPGGFIEGDTVFRSHATGGDIATAFGSIPYEHADSYSLTEFYAAANSSRLSLMAEGKVNWGTVRGYYEGDFIGVGTATSNTQSNSYLLRQRLLYIQAETNSHLSFTVGQMWSLATEDRKGITSAAADVAVPLTVDPNYMPGFVWTRQYGFRVIKSFDKAAFAVSVENPQVSYAATLAGNTPYAVLGSAGLNAGAFNAAISSCSPSTSVVNYTNEVDSDGNNVAIPVTKTLTSCTNLANISFNKAPDVLFKAAFDPGIGHYELFGIARFAHETVYPGETTNSNLYGGKDPSGNAIVDIKSGLAAAPALTTEGSYSNSINLGGFGASARVPVIKDKLSIGAKGLYGAGVGRYGSCLPDVTANASGKLAPVHNLSGLLSAELTPTPRLLVWSYYGGDYGGREDYSSPLTTTLAAPTAAQNAAGVWGPTFAIPKQAAVGYGSRFLSNTSCNVTSNLGINGASTGYYPGGSCGAQTRAVQEVAGGYWYDIYKGDRGRLRQGVQYGYFVREAWTGAGSPGIGAKGIENMFFTALRYTLP
jgi:hypothetical protein